MANSGDYKTIGLEAEKLRTLAEELQSIAKSLQPETKESNSGNSEVSISNYTQMPSENVGVMVDMAREIYRSRRSRARAFSDDALFGEPAWDMLLDLFIAEADGKPLSITAACIGAAVPTSTALRWLVILEERGLVRRENDPRDARRVFLHLTSEGYARMTAYFTQLQREG